MPSPTQLTAAVAGANLAASDLNTNWILMESSLGNVGPFIISGLVPSAGAGLSVSVTAGVALVGMTVTVAAPISIAGLANNTTNHLYLLYSGAGTSNTTGTAPANSVKLGTAVTLAGIVTGVAVTWASGRQFKVAVKDAVHGSGAGHPRAADLAAWHPSNNEGNEVKGQLPVGALPTNIISSGTFGGNGTAFALQRLALTFPSDADYTLLTAEMGAGLIDVQAGVITVPRNIIVPGTVGGRYEVINRNAQDVVLKTSGGTGITVTALRSRIIHFPTGVNGFALTGQQDFTT